jgi:hypothetical protein
MKKKCLAGLLAAIVILAQTVLVNAQEEPPPSLVEIFELSFSDLGYDDRGVSIDGDKSYALYVPGNVVFAAGQNYVDLLFSHTTAGTRFPASLVATFNGQLVGIVPLDASNTERGQVRLVLPAAGFNLGYNQLTVSLQAEIPCGEEKDVVFMALVHSESALHLEYIQSVQVPDLATYPLPFTERSLLPETVYFVLPSEPTGVDIATAATISAGFGRVSEGQTQVASVADTALTDEIRSNHHLIVIGQMGENRILSQLDLPLPLEPSAFSPEYGVVQEIASPWNSHKMLLVVTGQNAEGVFKAGAALNRDPHFLSMKGQVAIVEDVLPAENVEQIERRVDVTFDSLGYADMVFYGSRTQDVNYYFYMPLSWQIQESPKLVLAFQHAVLLDPNVSSLEVRLNKVPVGGVQLDKSNRTDGVVEIELPSWLLQSGGNRIEVQVKMDHPASGGDVCMYLNSEQIWTVIRRDSFIHLSYTLQSVPLDLGLFPYPFDVNVNLDALVLVLPDQLSDEERDGLLRLAGMLGAAARGNQLMLRASKMDELDEATKAVSNLLVVGQPRHNALIWELGDYLPQPFEPNSNIPAAGLDSVVLTPDPDRDMGFIQELPSPWNADRTILVLTGMTSRGVGAAIEALLTRGGEIHGNLTVVEGDELYSVDARALAPTERETPAVRAVPPTLSRLAEVADNWW